MADDGDLYDIPFLTAAVPLEALLNRDHFFFDIPAYQRSYQWSTREVMQLLQGLLHSYLAQVKEPARSQSVLLGNLVLLHTNSKDFAEAASGQLRWWLKGIHFCEIVDGQQRVSTLYMLFAAVQHKLLTSGQAEHLAAAEGLHKRLTTADRLILETLHSQFGEWFGMSTAGAYPGLTRLQNSKSRSAGREKSSALTILRWLDQVVADNQLDLLVFLRFINRRVFLSVTVTDDPELAIRQFADLNYSGATNLPTHFAFVMQLHDYSLK